MTEYSGPLPWYLNSVDVPDHIPSAQHARVKQFLETGYTVFEDSLPVKTCIDLIEDFRKLEQFNPNLFKAHKDNDGHYPRFVNLHAAMPSLLRLFYENEAALEFQDMMFGAETALYTSLFYERGSAQDLHRDSPYFATRPEYRYFGMWVALEDVDEGNGPLMAAPAGHLLPELDREAIARRHYDDLDSLPSDSNLLWDSYQGDVGEHCAAHGLKAVPIPVKRGSTILWHPHLPHGGAPILDISRTRFSLVMHTTPIGTPVYHQNVFFNPNKYFPTETTSRYSRSGGRPHVEQRTMSFGHTSEHPVEDFIGTDGRDRRPLTRRLSSLTSKLRQAIG